MIKETVIACVKPGDVVEIVPIDKVPNCERKFKVFGKTNTGFAYGITETCDGYEIPYSWIKSIKIVG